jgi:Rad3-related DNA helicase
VRVDLLAHFPPGFQPRPEQAQLLAALGALLTRAAEDPDARPVILVEAPPGVGKSHLAMALARWSGSAYLLTSQKLLQDQYEREFGDQVQLVKGRDNYACERYPGGRVTTSYGMCRRPRAPSCACPYTRAKAAAQAGPIFCTNLAYFLTLRQWHGEQLRRRRLLVIDEAHNLESHLVNVFTVSFSFEQMHTWFGGPLPRLDTADAYRPLLDEQRARLRARREQLERDLEDLRPPGTGVFDFLRLPPSPREQALMQQCDLLDTALARLGVFVDAGETEWVVRYAPGAGTPLELIPLTVAGMARDLLWDAAEIVVLSSAFLGRRDVLAGYFGLTPERVHALSCPSPFPVQQRPIAYRPIGTLSRTTLAGLEPALFAEVAAILAHHGREKGLIHAPSYAVARRLQQDLADRAPALAERLLFVESSGVKTRRIDEHRTSTRPTVLLSPSLREGVDLPDDFLRFQIITKVPYPDLGDPWTATRQARDPRWYALETAKAMVQAYGRSCRHAGDHGVTYVLDAQFARFLARYRPLLPAWFLDATDLALRAARSRAPGPPGGPAKAAGTGRRGPLDY